MLSADKSIIGYPGRGVKSGAAADAEVRCGFQVAAIRARGLRALSCGIAGFFSLRTSLLRYLFRKRLCALRPTSGLRLPAGSFADSKQMPSTVPSSTATLLLVEVFP
jgi:hypothetical protein